MKTLMMISIATGAMMAAGAASAQVVGGVTGQVGATVQTPPVTGTVQSTVRDARDMTRDTVRNARDVVQDARPEAEVRANAGVQADASADGDTTGLDAALKAGAMVHASDGAMLGTVVDVTRNTAGRPTAFTMRTADGAVRTMPTAGASAQGGAVVVARSE